MKKYPLIVSAVAASLSSCAEYPTSQPSAQKKPATPNHIAPTQSPLSWHAWAQWIEKRRSTADEQGHGPDIGSDEWAYSVDRQLGISEGGHGPDIKSSEWRHAVERTLGLHIQ